MITCLCRGLSDGAIRAVIARGASTVAEVRRACGAGGDCGACGRMVANLVAEFRSTRAVAPPAVVSDPGAALDAQPVLEASR